MTSNINDVLLTSIDETYPVAGKNNSSQGFRNNFARLKEGLKIASNELSYLHDKQLEITGDAVGISQPLGNDPEIFRTLDLTLSDSGVVAGDYTTENNRLVLSVDSKGRVIAVTSLAIPTRTVNGPHPATSVGTQHPTNIKQLTVPNFTLDEYGTVVSVASDTFDIGLEGHTLAKGNLIVGTESGAAKTFPMPSVSFLPTDYWVLAWRPVAGNEFGLAWTKLPAPTPVNPAKVISVVGGKGIDVVATDPANPVVDFAFAKLPDYPENQAIQTGSKLVMWDSATNNEYQIELSRVQNTSVTPPTFKVENDNTPKLGGDLAVNGRKITGERIKGITWETRDAGPFVLRNVTTIDPNAFNPNDPLAVVELPPEQWVVSEQRFPNKKPPFTAAEITAGASAFLKINNSGQMFWSKESTSAAGVTEITAGVGITMSPTGSITRTGTISVDFSNAPIQAPKIYSDNLVAMDANRTLYKNTISKFTFTVPKILVVDPEYGSTNTATTTGQLNDPYKTIQLAINRISDGDPSIHFIYLLPGTYNENVLVNRQNVQLISMMGPEVTKFRGSFDILPGMGRFVLKGINLDIALTTATKIIEAVDGIDSFHAEDCWFHQDPTERGRPQEIINFAGTQNGSVTFERCKFNGRLVNNFAFADPDGFMDAKVRINNTISDMNNLLFITVGEDSNTEVNNVSLLGQATHNGGILDLKNIGGIVGDFSEAVWTAADPDEEDLETLGFIREGIQSTAAYSSSYKNFLTLSNVSMRYYIDARYFAASSIQKTGTCEYSMANVMRKTDIDNIAGNRYDNHGPAKGDVSDYVRKLNVNGALTVDARQSVTWDLTLTGNSTLTLTGAYTMPNAFADINQATTLRVALHQDATGGRTVTWGQTDGSIIWDGGIAPTMPTAANKVMLVEFMQVGNIWFGRKLVSN